MHNLCIFFFNIGVLQFPPKSKNKDFDGIYLENPTGLIARIEQDGDITDLMKYLVQVESLTDVGEMSYKEAESLIKDGFKKLYFHEYGNSQISRTSESYCIYVTKIIIQAVGRMCRTNMKNPNIYIYYDYTLANFIDQNVGFQNLINPEFKILLSDLDESSKNITEKNRKLKTAAINKSEALLNRIEKYVSYIILGFWEDNAIKDWQKIRFELLKNPSLTQEEYNNCSELIKPFYIEMPEDQNKYWFKRTGDYDSLEDISFTEQVGYEEVSSEQSRLNCFLKLKEVRDYFNKNNLAKDIAKKKYMLCPPAFTNIYKGALGEYVGRIILEKSGIELEDIDDNTLFELFDYKVPNKDIYVDFKNWNEYSFFKPNKTSIENKIFEKMAQCNSSVVFVINIFANENYKNTDQERDGRKIIEIPCLYSNAKDMMLNITAINKIRKVIEEN